jgi:predicted ATPase
MQKLAAHQKSPLTGRKRELHQLWNLFEASATGQTHVVFVSGEPGIGGAPIGHGG